MGIPDYTLVDLIKKVRSWISWGSSDSNSMAFGFKITENDYNCFCHCGLNTSNSCIKYRCFSCGRWLCEKCVKSLPSSGVDHHSCLKEKTEAIFSIEACKLCIELGPVGKTAQRCSSGKVHPCESPRKSLDQSSPSFSGEKFDGHFPCSVAGIADESSSNHSSPVTVHHSSSSCDEDEVEDFNVSSEYLNEISDVDSVCARARHEFCSSISIGSSPSNSPSRINITSNRVGHCVQRELELNSDSRDDGSFNPEQAILKKPAGGIWDSGNEKLPEPFNFENNGLIWIPPPPDDAAHGEESSFFMYDDEDDEVGESGAMFSSNTSFDSASLGKDKKLLDSSKEPLRAAVEGHFRALGLQLLQGQGIISTDENSAEDWLNIIAAISWQTANYIKPDTKRGGSMDPCDYVKVKCVASGNPSQSKLVKGIVCTKNIKHKRMTSQYKNTRLLLLGGALEYQRVPNQLASLDTLLQQEKDHLKMVISKIDALRPNVLLVEKSVSSFAQDQLLAKEISLVLNVKRPLLERIARCTGAFVTPSIDYIHKTRLGHCELFHLEKIVEDREPVNQFNKRPSKTLMFFEGCPRRLGCTVVLRGSSLEELKKVKNVVQYAIFAAYHLLLETSFLADEGAILPKSPQFTREKTILSNEKEEFDLLQHVKSVDLNLEQGLQESLSELEAVDSDDDFIYRKALMDACDEVLALDGTLGSPICSQVESPSQVESQSVDDADVSSEYFSANESSQSILVSFASHCILSGSVCERRLLRVKFYGPSDKPLGRYLREDLFDETCHCNSCKESAEAHSICYTHQHGNLMINVRRLSSIRLPGEEDGKIWMWHRCLKCTHIEGIPPSTRRVVMSDSAWGLSFGKFLELSFSKYATGNRVASCGHSLQRDCLRFYGFGSMVAFFRYSPISILSVRLPPPFLEFCRPGEQRWIREEASELLSKAEALYAEIAALLLDINQRSLSSTLEFSDASDLHGRVLELSDMVAKEQNYYQDLLQPPNKEIQEQDQAEIDIIEINRLRHSLIISSDVWDRRLYLLDSLLRRSSGLKIPNKVEALNMQEGSGTLKDTETEHPTLDECAALFSNNEDILPLCMQKKRDGALESEEDATSLERRPSAGSILSDKIDSAWSGADMAVMGACISALEMNQKESPAFRRLLSPTRVYSFDSAQRLQERMSKELPPHLHLSTIRSFHASGDFKFMLRDPVSRNVQRTYSQALPSEAEKFEVSPSFIQFLNILPEGARLLIPQQDVVITVYDNEPTSMISYALISKEYINWISNKQTNGHEREVNATALINNSYSSLDFDCMHYGNYTSEDTSIAGASLFADPKTSPHLRIFFEDESPAMSEKMKFDVTCYFAREFDALRKICCPNEMDFICSLSRCRRWRAQGGKSNVYFAKSFDERFIIKEVTKTELESFNEVSSEYFKYLTNAINSGSPTCLAKILGIYQIAVKPSKGGKEKKMDLMVMENLFFKRTVSKVYDLKGSARSRYNPDTTGANKVMLDMNLLETLRTNPIFLGSQAKRKLERAVWNDTSFLARVDVMDYSLLVGVDEDRNELVLGIIDYMRQYTWDKHLETWVKASGILGGAKNASPTIVSPKQYKKRFRKAMTAYFLTVPDHWSS